MHSRDMTLVIMLTRNTTLLIRSYPLIQISRSTTYCKPSKCDTWKCLLSSLIEMQFHNFFYIIIDYFLDVCTLYHLAPPLCNIISVLLQMFFYKCFVSYTWLLTLTHLVPISPRIQECCWRTHKYIISHAYPQLK